MISKEMLAGLDLGHFVDVCRVFFGQMGFVATETDSGAASGLSRVNILYNKKTNDPLSIFQCHVGYGSADFQMVSSFYEIMGAVNMTNGYFLSTGSFTEDLIAYGAANRINLVDLDKLVELINKLPELGRNIIREIVSQGDDSSSAPRVHSSEVPECAKCGFRMRLRVTEGKYREGSYWECPNPDCKHITALIKGHE
jgi:restriction system protein